MKEIMQINEMVRNARTPDDVSELLEVIALLYKNGKFQWKNDDISSFMRV